MQKKEQNPLRRRRRIRQLIGAVVCLLVVVGLATLLRAGFLSVAKLTDNSGEKAEFETRLTNLVAKDPLPFDTLGEANQDLLLSAAIWGTLAEADQSVYERDDIGQPYLPTVDVDNFVAKLYGKEFKFEYKSFEDNQGLAYTYIEDKQAYLIPITGAMAEYFPRVAKIKREKDTKRVTVGYLSPYGAGGEFNASTTLKPVKYLDYIFTKQDKEYYLSAITESKMKVEASSDLPPATVSEALPTEDLTGADNAVLNENGELLPQVSAPASSAAASSAPSEVK
ncbi:MAG: hypothetical protein RR675_00640 [Oscillospiraceae bacterium]